MPISHCRITDLTTLESWVAQLPSLVPPNKKVNYGNHGLILVFLLGGGMRGWKTGRMKRWQVYNHSLPWGKGPRPSPWVTVCDTPCNVTLEVSNWWPFCRFSPSPCCPHSLLILSHHCRTSQKHCLYLPLATSFNALSWQSFKMFSPFTFFWYFFLKKFSE